MQKIISLVGLTASGKSGIGIKLARAFGGEIISCDSRQVYTGLDLGTGKVTKAEQEMARHHLIDIIEPPKTAEYKTGESLCDVHKFQKLAYAAIEGIIKRGKIPILVGGTGLYSRAVIEGYDFGKDKAQGIYWGQKAAGSLVKNAEKNGRKFDVLQIALMPPKEWIVPRIAKRVDERLEQGMIDETRRLLDNGVSEEWLSTLGLEYYWNVELIRGRITMDEYRYWLVTRITQFAKRQRTWFKREKNTIFLANPETFEDDCFKLVGEFVLTWNSDI